MTIATLIQGMINELSNPTHYILISANIGSVLAGGYFGGRFIQRLKNLEDSMQEVKQGQVRIESDIKNILLKGL